MIKGGEQHMQAGGGIVHASQPDAEWEETMNRARAMMRTVELAEKGSAAAGGVPARQHPGTGPRGDIPLLIRSKTQ